LLLSEIVGTVTQQGIAFSRRTADFVSDITVGRLYLPETEYQKPIDAFKDSINAIPVDHLKQLTAENWVDLSAHVAADFVFCKGFGSAFIYLKEIDAMSKVQQQAAKVARTFDTHLADNPIVVTAEGLVLKTSNDLKKVGGTVKEVIIDSRAFIESMTHGLLAEIRQEIIDLRTKFACLEKCVPECAKRGFAEFKNGHIKIAYEHILGIELIWNDAKKHFIRN
jgi:hypothetical protein